MARTFGHARRLERTAPRALAILLVESDADNRELYAEYLRYSSAAVTTVETTDAALPIARSADVIVTGMRVHGTFDGLTLVKRLRAREDTRHATIIVLTACVFERDEQMAFAAGCDAFLRKPCDPETLVQTINRLLKRQTSSATELPAFGANRS
ncbi:MAG TPA: response regulator [Vicinamibacterales bacterium]|nr:response regulator [Vicinamibacterales bacterium]